MKYRWHFFIPAILILGILVILVVGSVSPRHFPNGIIVTIPDKMSVSEAADLLVEKGVIKSAFLYKAYVILLHDGKGIRAGDYLFQSPQSALRVAYRTAYGIAGIPQVKVTIPEGLASSDIARLIVKSIPAFDGKGFMALARPKEGRLFPDTYFFYENVTPEKVVSQMEGVFQQKTSGLAIPIFLSGKSFDDVLTMASIVEEEASSSPDRRIIAGILWKRLDAGMPLQVDAPFFYILGKTSAQLTLTDLATSSPYNLYKHKGLPPGPIDNPGLGAILDTMNPTKTDYWFYLADKNGKTHYSATFETHDINKDKYIN